MTKTHYRDNPDYYKERHKSYYPTNVEAYRERNRRWALENPEKAKEHQTKYNKLNPHTQLALNAKRRSRLRNQTPELTAEESQRIKDLYWLARDLRAVSGEEYHVDHIVALANGGLHHPDNLQILPADINIRKAAK